MSRAISRAPPGGAAGQSGKSKGSARIVIGLLVAAAVLLLLAIWFANRTTDIDSHYGKRSGVIGGKSVNGTAVLAKMFEQAGHRVTSTTWLTPSLGKKADVVVWFPNDFALPNDKVTDWFDQWLDDAPDRTLIYVGRDFDAEPVYWEKLQPRATGEELQEIRLRRFEASSRFTSSRNSMPASEEFDWFTSEGASKPRDVRTLSGQPDWVAQVDASKIEIELHGRLAPPQDAQLLLESEGDALVSRLDWGQGRVIVVTNGSFLLNVPLINREHRKLATRLIEEVGSQRRVVFLESDVGGPNVFDADPAASQRTGLEVLTVPPLDWILLHLAALGVIFCFTRWPIFGPARQQESSHLSDFGKHVQALGRLLEATRDRAYALARLQHYRQTVRHDGAPYRHSAAQTQGYGQIEEQQAPADQHDLPAATTDRPN